MEFFNIQELMGNFDENEIWKLNCNAGRDSEGYYDCPPHKVSAPYPYSFNNYEGCYAKLEFGFNLISGLPNVNNRLKVYLDNKLIYRLTAECKLGILGNITEKFFNNKIASIDLGWLNSGYHDLEFEVNWVERRDLTFIHRQPNRRGMQSNPANGYFTLKWIKVLKSQ